MIGQTTDWWKIQVNTFEELTRYIKPNSNIILGDSIAQAFRISEFIPEHHFLNRGIDGDTILGVLKRLDCSVYSLNPKMVFILIGTNDIPSRTNDDILSSYKELLLNIISNSPETEIFVLSILPTCHWPDRPNKRIIEINEKLEELTKQLEVNYLNIHSMFCDDKKELRSEYTNDGLHLTQAGYNVLAKTIKGCLK